MEMTVFFFVLLASSVQAIDLPKEWLPPIKDLCTAFEKQAMSGPPIVIDVALSLELTSVRVSRSTTLGIHAKMFSI